MNGGRREQSSGCLHQQPECPSGETVRGRHNKGKTAFVEEPDIAERLVQGRLVCVVQTKHCEEVCVKLVVRKRPTSTRKRPQSE